MSEAEAVIGPSSNKIGVITPGTDYRLVVLEKNVH